MRLAIALSSVVVVLAAAAPAQGGGWATVGLVTPPGTIEAGTEWVAEITVLRHGRTLTDGARPNVIIREEKTGQSRTFRATPAGTVGRYEAAIVFPEAGTWTVAVDNGLAATGYGVSQTTAFGTVNAQAPGAGGGGLDVPLLEAAVGVLAALLITAAGVVGLRRLRRLPVASQ
jgi:hypothetical protein